MNRLNRRLTRTEQHLYETAYWPTNEQGRNLLCKLGFTPKTQTQGDNWWFPAIAVYLAFYPDRPPLLSTEDELKVLRAIAADTDLESALAAVWLSERENRERFKAVIEYIKTSLPELFEANDRAVTD